jgi:hypothetical protein
MTGPTGAIATGPTGNSGIPIAGTTNQILVKQSNSNYDTKWSSTFTGTSAILSSYIDAPTINPSYTEIKIGTSAGLTSQGTDAVAIGDSAGQTSQGQNSVAIGVNAGNSSQGIQSVAIGQQAGFTGQGQQSVAIGALAAAKGQASNGIAIGYNAASIASQGTSSIAIGSYAGGSTQGINCVSVGSFAAAQTQGNGAVSVGQNAGRNQAGGAVSIGQNTGATSQGAQAIAVGLNAGNSNQGASSISIGYLAGQTSQGVRGIGIGASSANISQGIDAIAFGADAGGSYQGANSIAIGRQAGFTGQGTSSIAIGRLAGETSQHDNTIILNSSGFALNSDRTDALFMNPIRNTGTSNFLFYNTATSEVSYSNNAVYVSGTVGNLTITDTATLNLIRYTNTIRMNTGSFAVTAPFYSKYLIEGPTGAASTVNINLPSATDLTDYDGLTLHFMNVSYSPAYNDTLALNTIAGSGTTIAWNTSFVPQNQQGHFVSNSVWIYYDKPLKNWNYQNMWY